MHYPLLHKHCVHCGSPFDKISIYEYLQFIFIVERSQQQNTNYKFDIKYRHRRDFIQRPLKHIEQIVFIVLCKNLSKNKKLEDAILRDYPKIDVYRTNLSLVFLSLFMLWNY